MKFTYKALKAYGYRIGQVDKFTVDVDTITGLLELIAHIPATKQDIGKQLVIFEDYFTSANYDRLTNWAHQAEQCAIANS